MTNTLIDSDDRGLKKVLGQKQPAILVMVDGNKDKPLEDALQREAKKHGDELLIIRVDVSQNSETYERYDRPELPALVTLTKAFFGRTVKSQAEKIRPADIRTHIDHLLNDTPVTESKPQKANESQPVSKKAIHVTAQNFRKDVLKSTTPVLVDFWAAWCVPCQSVAPFVDQMAKKYEGQVKVVKLNVDENQSIANQYGVQSIPTFILFEGGQPVQRLTGANPRAIETIIKDATI